MTGTPTDSQGEKIPGGRHSRRRFLGVAIGSTALAVAGVTSRARQGADETASQEALEDIPASSAPVLAYVRDASKGEVVFLVGTSELVRRDKRLASRLIAMSREEASDVVAS